LDGLVPGGEPIPLSVKVDAAMEQLRQKSKPIEKYIFLQTIQDSDEVLYYAILTSHTTEGKSDCIRNLILVNLVFAVMPLVYTPVVGEVFFPDVFIACRFYNCNDLLLRLAKSGVISTASSPVAYTSP
jgi:hypothetical protein